MKTKIIIMGTTGKGKQALYSLNNNAEAIAFLDNNYDVIKTNTVFNLPVYPVPKVTTLNFDYVVLPYAEYAEDMKKQLLSLNVPQEKIIEFNYHNPLFINDLRYCHAINCLTKIKNENIAGSMAEVGVFQGEFSKVLNMVIPEKKLFLFDTFEGFSNKDYDLNDNRNNYFSNTSVELVLNKMTNKNTCHIMKGFFPESIPQNFEETFCFVSLDADLFSPIYQGLQFFYPRLNKGGYIFVHDYDNTQWPGSKKAVEQFCRENALNFFPLLDRGLSAVLMK